MSKMFRLGYCQPREWDVVVPELRLDSSEDTYPITEMSCWFYDNNYDKTVVKPEWIKKEAPEPLPF